MSRKQNLRDYCEVEARLPRYERLFTETVGKPWSLQRTWMKRVLKGNSFAIVAPTGVGKTTFGLITALYMNGRSLLVFPTRLLAGQAYERLTEMTERLLLKRKVLLYESKRKVRDRFLSGDWEILLGTNMFFHKNFGNLMNFRDTLAFVFLDDIDSFLKRAKNVDMLFKLLGFSDRDIELALKRERSEREERYLERLRERRRKTVLVVSSATLKPKTSRVVLFRNLLGFDIQKATTNVRNVVDTYFEVEGYEEALKEAGKLSFELGKGGLIFLPSYAGRDEVKRVGDYLRGLGLRVITYLDGRPQEVYERMKAGEFDVGVGLSHIHNPFVRGLDLPDVIRWALFLDVPKFLIPVSLSLRPSHLHSMLLALMDLFPEEERIEARKMVAYLRRYLNMREEALERYPRVKAEVERIKGWLERWLKDSHFLQRIRESEDVSLMELEGQLYVVVADVSTYLQASGRTSRLIAGGMTKGLSVLAVWDRKAFRSLKRRMRFYFMEQEVSFVPLKEIDLRALLAEIDRDRERARAVLSGKMEPTVKDLFRTTLVIVESPNKARTISSFFGKPQMRVVGRSIAYEIPVGDRVMVISASLGHVLDLSTEGGFFGVIERDGRFVGTYDTIKRCLGTGEQHTEYDYLKRRCREEEIEDKLDIIRALQELGYEVDEVFVATDPDAEGEKIAYDLYLHLRSFNRNVKRAEFHEITPRAFRDALMQPQEVSTDRVKAQMTRRIADRWVGFTLSRKLWEVFGNEHLSAGRVQTPVLGWVIERTRESRKKAYALRVRVGNITLERIYETWREAKDTYETLKGGKGVGVEVEVLGEEERGPLPPYTTDSILEDTDRYLGLGAAESMAVLQELFEKGVITYHRTDSTRVSDYGKFSVAKPFIAEHFGEEYFTPRTWGEGGAHECIRPTRPITPDTLKSMVAAGLVSFSSQRAVEVYDLVFRRFMASEMRKALVLKGRLKVLDLSDEVVLEVIRDGFNLLWPTFTVFNGEREVRDVILRKVPKARPYTEGTLIQEMKRRGLGRPSTYAKIVEVLLRRRYVVRSKRGYLYSTPLGERVYSFLVKRYGEYVSEDFTRRIEKAMDDIEEGKVEWTEVLRELYSLRRLLKEG